MVATSSNDYYELLGVSKTADDKEIKSSYKKAARKYHPDNSETGDEELFKKVGEAYEVLKDPNKRSVYDQYGAEGLKGAGGFGAGGFGGYEGAAGFDDLGDIFSSFFGQGFSGGSRRSSGPRPSRGQDHSVSVNLKFLDPLEEITKKIQFNPLVTCNTCDGKGAEKAEDIVSCDTCNGVGQVTTVQNTLLGQIRQNATCPSCKGTGKQIKKACKGCKGKGQKREDKEVEVKIPAGVFDGATMRLSGVGDAGRHGGPPGDIYLQINVEDSSLFTREDADVISEIDIGFADAALGLELDLKTLEGSENFKVKTGTQSGDVYTLKNKGFPVLNNANRRGHQYVKVNVITPKNLNGDEKKLLKEFQKLRNNKDISV